MRSSVVLFTLVMLNGAAAQFEPLPIIVQLYDNATNRPIGTATYSGNRIYFRDPNGKHTATVVIGPDGRYSAFDEGGRPIAMPPLPPLPK